MFWPELSTSFAIEFFGRAENFSHGVGAHAFDVAQPLGDVEDERVGALLRNRKVALGLFPLRHCLAPVDLSPDGKAGKYNGDKREPGDPKPLAAALRPLCAPEHLVGAKTDERRHDLGKRHLFPVGGDVGCQHLGGIGRNQTVRADVKPHGWWEGFRLGIPHFSVGYDRDHRTVRMARLKQAHLFIDIVALGRSRGAKDDHRGRCVECGDGLLGEAVPGSELVSVAEDGSETRWDRPRRGVASNQFLVDRKILEPPVQPLRPLGVRVAVGKEGAVLEGGGLSHEPLTTSCYPIIADAEGERIPSSLVGSWAYSRWWMLATRGRRQHEDQGYPERAEEAGVQTGPDQWSLGTSDASAR